MARETELHRAETHRGETHRGETHMERLAREHQSPQTPGANAARK